MTRRNVEFLSGVPMPADSEYGGKSGAPPRIPTCAAPVPRKARRLNRFGLFTGIPLMLGIPDDDADNSRS